MPNSSIWSIDRTLSDVHTTSQSRPGSKGNEEILRIPQSSSITRASPLDCFVSYPEHSLERFNPSEEIQSVYSAAPVDWAWLLLESVTCDLRKLPLNSPVNVRKKLWICKISCNMILRESINASLSKMTKEQEYVCRELLICHTLLIYLCGVCSVFKSTMKVFLNFID